MKRLKAAGVWTAVLLAAGLLALAGCGDDGGTPAELLAGAAIEEPFEPRVDAITSSGFTIVASSAAVVADPNPGNQVAQHGVSTTTNGTVSWRDPGELVFTGLRADETYYIWARAAATSEYAAGKALMADTDPVETKPEGEDASVRGSWEPTPTFNEAGTNFTILPATPVVSGQTVEYAMSNSNTTVPTTWISTPPLRFNLSRLGDDPTETQYYFWARTTASGSDPAGTPLFKEVALPGPTLTSVNWSATGNGLDGASAILNITGSFTKTPDISALEIQFGLGTSATATEGIVWSPTAPVDGSLTIGGLAAQTTYYLYARTKQTNNFAAGRALLYNSTFTVTTTTSNTSSATGLLAQLNGMKTKCASIAENAPNTVVLLDDVDLNANITIPQGVRLSITDGKKLDAKYFNVTGGGTIEVVTGELVVNEYHVSAIILVHQDGTYTSTAGLGTQKVIAPSSTTPPPASIMSVTSGVMTVKVTNNKFDWHLAGEAKVNSTPSALKLNPQDTLTIAESATFDVSHEDGLDAAGKIEVNKGGTLKFPSDYDFANGLDSSTGAQIVLHGGAKLEVNNTTIIADIAEKNATTPANAYFYLDPSAASKVEIKLLPKLNPNGTAVVDGDGNPLYDTRYTITSVGKAVEVGNTAAKSGDILVINAPLTIPADKKLTMGGTDGTGSLTVTGALTINGTLESNTALNAGAVTIGSGGELDIKAKGVLKTTGAVTISGTTTSNGKLTIAGPATAPATGTGTWEAGGAINVNGGGVLSINSGTVLKSSSTIEVKGGSLWAPIDFSAFNGTTMKINLDKDASFYEAGSNPSNVFMGVKTTGTGKNYFVYADSPGTNPNIAIAIKSKTVNGVSVDYPEVTLNANIGLYTSHTIPVNHEYIVPGGSSSRTLTIYKPTGGTPPVTDTSFIVKGKLTINGQVNFETGTDWGGNQTDGTVTGSGNCNFPAFMGK